MHRDILFACWPFVAALLASVVVAVLLVRLSGGQLCLTQLRRLHRDQQGGVQSLSFVLTLPLFMMVMMFIVQLSQLTIAKVTVEYAAFAAARSAMVWIPAVVSDEEDANRISMLTPDGMESGDDGATYHIYKVESGSPKFEKIHLAAATACMPICPSRNVGASTDHASNAAVDSLQAAYQAISPASSDNSRIPSRLSNKLAYALENTQLELTIHHKEDRREPPLASHEVPRDLLEFHPNEIGWQDQIIATVTHDFALLPGPGRILARRTDARPGSSAEDDSGTRSTAERIERNDNVYTYEITATVRLSNEGEKSVLPYQQQLSTGGGN
jgi:hypothetical protein